MNKKLFAWMVSLFLLTNSPAGAYKQQVAGEKLCFVEGVMEELLREAAKETVNTVGKHILNRYLSDKEKNNNGQNSENAEKQGNSDKTES